MSRIVSFMATSLIFVSTMVIADRAKDRATEILTKGSSTE